MLMGGDQFIKPVVFDQINFFPHCFMHPGDIADAFASIYAKWIK